MEQIHGQRADMYEEGNGHDKGFQYPLHIEAAAVFDSGSNTVSAAERNKCVAHVEDAGGGDTHSTKKALREGNGEGADVIAR